MNLIKFKDCTSLMYSVHLVNWYERIYIYRSQAFSDPSHHPSQTITPSVTTDSREQKTGDFKAVANSPSRKNRKIQDLDRFEQFLKQNQDKTQRQIAEL